MYQFDVVSNNYILYFLIPMWIVPGVADWACHRRSGIEATSGLPEAVLHYLMITVVGVPILMGLLFEINALVILVMIVAYFAHLAMALCDVTYAVSRRVVTPVEQHVHSFLEVLPFMGTSFVICLYWGQFLALFGAGGESARFGLRLKDPLLPTPYLVGIFSAVLVFLILPYGEEVWRCYRAAARAKAASRAGESG